MDKQAFIADFIAKNQPKPGRRVRGRQASPEIIAERAEAAWAAYNSPDAIKCRELVAAGGNEWTSPDGAKRRVYFDAKDAYYDLVEKTWSRNGQWVVDPAAIYELEKEVGLDPEAPKSAEAAAPKPIKKPTNKPSPKAQSARATAKLFGGRALKGTAKQKEWGEKIREEKIKGMTEAQAELACDPSGLLASAKLWIENREKSAREIGAFAEQQKALLATANDLRERGDAEGYAQAAAAYNALTQQWGFE
jgi:hypothetical protein